MRDSATMEVEGRAAAIEAGQFVTFDLGCDRFAFPMTSVKEIVRVPRTFPVPQAHAGLLGLFNLRGLIVPAVDLRCLLAMSKAEMSEASRIIIVDVGTRIGLLVDRVSRVLSVGDDQIEGTAALGDVMHIEFVRGVIKNQDQLIQWIDPKLVLDKSFAISAKAAAATRAMSDHGSNPSAERITTDAADHSTVQLVSFDVGAEEFALPIAEVEQIVRIPKVISAIPGAPPHILGLMDLRGQLLPLLQLSRAMGGNSESRGEQARVVVVRLDQGRHQDLRIGMVVDRVREVLRVPKTLKDPVPPLIGGGQMKAQTVDSVCRLEDGQRLVCVLRSELLVHTPGMKEALSAQTEEKGSMAATESIAAEGRTEETQLVVFMLDGQEYGVAIESVQEIIRVPTTLNRIPRTPEWVEGVVNLRNQILAVLDMRARLGLKRVARAERQRILVFSFSGVRTGFIVDAVSEVLRLPLSSIERAPDCSESDHSGVDRVANLADQNRMIMLLNTDSLMDEEIRAQVSALG